MFIVNYFNYCLEVVVIAIIMVIIEDFIIFKYYCSLSVSFYKNHKCIIVMSIYFIINYL